MTSKPFVNEPKNQALCELSHLFAELFNRVLIPPIADIAEEARAIMARDPAVQVLVLRAAANHWGDDNSPAMMDDTVLADAIETGDIVLEIPE